MDAGLEVERDVPARWRCQRKRGGLRRRSPQLAGDVEFHLKAERSSQTRNSRRNDDAVLKEKSQQHLFHLGQYGARNFTPEEIASFFHRVPALTEAALNPASSLHV